MVKFRMAEAQPKDAYGRTGEAAARAVLIVGGTRGLGLDLARELSGRGWKIALCARDPDEVERAWRTLSARGGAVMAEVCDASDREQVEAFVHAAHTRFGAIDMLITCAAIIQVGPMELMNEGDVHEALQQIFWSAYHPTLAVLPHMRRQRAGRIVHMSSFGGKIGMPHMLPYCTAKFALTGFSASLRAEVAKDGISVTTVTPGLLRTGAYVNTPFKGQHEKEYAWFSAGMMLPGLSMASSRAAKRILRAAERGAAEATLTPWVRGLVLASALAPKLVARALSLQNRLLPSALGGSAEEQRGADIAASSRSRLVRAIDAIGRENACRHHAYPGPVHVEPLVARGAVR